MLKLFKEKMLVSLVVVMLVALVFGSISSLATTIKPSSSSNNTAKTAATDNTVGAAVNTNKSTNTNTNTNKATNTNKTTNTNTNKNVANKAASKLPYAGSNSSLIFVVIALSASAVYAYKKVSDYNV